MKSLTLIGFLFLTIGCATRTPQTERLIKNRGDLPLAGHIKNIPHVIQKENHCGPATLVMVLNHLKKNVSAEVLAHTMMITNLKGTFQADMLLEARRQGMLTFKISSLEQLLTEVSHGNPIIVFQNVGLESLPQWHYSVVTGYDLSVPQIYLHSGPDKNDSNDLRFFERTWLLGGKWALLVLPAGKLSSTASEVEHVEAASHLEELKFFQAAQVSYHSILKKWPQSLMALIGLSNVSYRLGQKKLALTYLKNAVALHPAAGIAWHNLASLQGEMGQLKEARLSSKKAIENVHEESRTQFTENLKSYL